MLGLRPLPITWEPPENPAAALAYWERAAGHVGDQIARHRRQRERAQKRRLKGLKLKAAWGIAIFVAAYAAWIEGPASALLTALLLGASLALSLYHNRRTIADASNAIRRLEADLDEVNRRKASLEAHEGTTN